jgi:hypothetical protein
MQRKAMWTVVALIFLATLAVCQAQQAQQDYLDVYTVQVKPEKRADFDAISRKMVTINRQNKGDTWLAMETAYGPGNRITFVSTRHSYGEAEEATGAFMQALEKGVGRAGSDKMLSDFNQCLISSRSEFRRRRWDLSSNPPDSPEAMARLVGEARWLRTVVVHVKPGQLASFESMLKDLKTAREKTSPAQTVLVSQAVAGQEGTVFYVTSLQTTLGAFDALPTLQQTLGDQGYEKFLKTNEETVAHTETVINRFLPDLSNAPEQIAAVAPDYWRPKAAAVNAKASKPKAPVVNAGATTKEENPK